MRAARVSALVTVATLAASCSTPLATTAAALEPGVQIDPGSPAAKEYVLPVGQARRTGSGRESTPSSPAQESAESASEPLFGAGITPPSSGGRSGRGARSAGRSGDGMARGSTRSHARAAGGQPPPALVRRVADGHSSSGGGSSALVLFAGGVGLLVLAAFAGIVLRHSRRPTAAS
jgi:hypothetical protein